MLMLRPIFISLILLSHTLCSQIQREHFKDFRLITDMMDSVKKVNYIRFSMRATERIENGYSTAHTRVKLQMHPRKSYLKNVDTKLEVLYNEEKLPNKCTVKPHIFPYFTMTLDPRGNLMRKNQHFTIYELGFDFTVKTIAMALSKEKEQIVKHLSMIGKVEKNKMNCYLFVYENPNFAYYDYTVQAKETVAGIASKLVVNDYLIRTKNKLFDEYGYVKQGTKLKIPNFYCKKAVIYIDEKSMLPVSMSIYDEVGLFENYEYSDIELHKKIPDEEFERNFKGYGF